MKKKVSIGAAFIAFLIVAGFSVFYETPKGEGFWTAKAHDLIRDTFQFQPTNNWQDVRGDGGFTFRFLGRKRVEYFLIQQGARSGLDEIQNKFQTCKTGGDVSAFSYLPNYDPKNSILEGRAAKIAPWWDLNQASQCTFVRIGTNLQGTAWSMMLFAVPQGSNAVLYTHIIESVD
jgi:hypothetical protein